MGNMRRMIRMSTICRMRVGMSAVSSMRRVGRVGIVCCMTTTAMR